MFNQTHYQVIITPTGEQIIRSSTTTSKTVIDVSQRTGAVSVHPRA